MGRSGLNLGITDDLHHAAGSHRWIAPLNVDAESWRETVQAHLDLAQLEGGCHEAVAKVRTARRGRGARMPEQRRVS